MKFKEYLKTPGKHKDRERKIMRKSMYGMGVGVLLALSVIQVEAYYKIKNKESPKIINYLFKASNIINSLSIAYLVLGTGANFVKANKERKNLEKQLAQTNL